MPDSVWTNKGAVLECLRRDDNEFLFKKSFILKKDES